MDSVIRALGVAERRKENTTSADERPMETTYKHAAGRLPIPL